MCKAHSAVVPGSYDPVTLGHLAMIREAACRYERVHAVVFINPDKKCLFDSEKRLAMLRLAVADIANVTVDFSTGLVVDYMKDKGIDEIFKGYRSDADLEYERKMAEWNKKHGGYDTVMWRCPDELSSVSSSAVRASLAEGKIPAELLPDAVCEYLSNNLQNILYIIKGK